MYRQEQGGGSKKAPGSSPSFTCPPPQQGTKGVMTQALSSMAPKQILSSKSKYEI